MNKSQSFWLVGCGLLIAYFQPILFGIQTHDDTPIELSGFSVSQAFEIPDGQPLDVEEEKFQRILYRASKTSQSNLREYAKFSTDVSWQNLIDRTPDYRFWVFHRQGHVHSVTRIDLSGADRDDQIKIIYRADCVSDSGQRFQVIMLTIPSAWSSAEKLNEPIQFAGFLYAMTTNDSDERIPLFIAKRMEWFPASQESKLKVTPSQQLLARNGVDVGGLDRVRQQQNQKLGSVDAEIFYQFLAAVDSIPIEPAVPIIDFSQLMKNPMEQIGNAVGFQARVRKCSLVQRPDSKLGDLQSVDHYYQLMVFPDLAGTVKVKTGNDSADELVYRRFPVTVCCRHLPIGMTPSQLENQQIWVSGFYYRFWKYGSQRTDAAGVAGQVSPIIISRQPIRVVSDEANLNLLLGGILIGLLFSLFGLAWFFRSSSLRATERSGRMPDRIELPLKE